jgi:hypothetical protein
MMLFRYVVIAVLVGSIGLYFYTKYQESHDQDFKFESGSLKTQFSEFSSKAKNAIGSLFTSSSSNAKFGELNKDHNGPDGDDEEEDNTIGDIDYEQDEEAQELGDVNH